MDSEKLAYLRDNERPVVIGLGAIGSWVARWLLANGIPFVGYDDDRVSLKNLAAGAFEESQVGAHKASSIDGQCINFRWERGNGFRGTAVLVCADHGPTRRDAAEVADMERQRFVCAKANGSQWQVWDVAIGKSPLDFMAFDEAAEANPVLVPCGDASVGRTASLGAAAELLSVWAEMEISADDVESAWGVKFDPAIAHFVQHRWHIDRLEAEAYAQEKAEKAFKQVIDDARDSSDQLAVRELKTMRETRRVRKIVLRTTIHQRAVYLLDSPGESTRSAARIAVGSRQRSLAYLIKAESKANANKLTSDLALPETIVIEEVSA